MAVCTFCDQEMTTARSCSVGVLHRAGTPVAMIPWRRAGRCGDCGVSRGGFHHLGCDTQRCPSCGGQMIMCGCRFDEDGPVDPFDGELFVDSNGCLAERKVVAGREVIVHYDDVPESDITTVDGIRVTTPLRTVIDIAPDVDAAHLDEIVQDFLRRRLFTIDEARARLAEPDMWSRPGALLLRRVLRL
jgi:hypothetical protein